MAKASAVKRLNPLFTVILAALLLGDVITGMMGIGTLLIAIGFLMLLRTNSVVQSGGAPAKRPLLAHLYGSLSAFCYALGFINRKLALASLPDPVLGTLIGAAAALIYYAVAATVVPDYRRAIREAYANVHCWQLAAAIFVSIGQILMFAAIQLTEVSKVAMISLMEVFIAMFLSVFLMRTETRPDGATLLAAVVATVGAILVAIG